MPLSEKRKTVLLLLLTLGWTVFIFQRSLQPAEISHDESVAVMNPLLQIFPWLSLYAVRKLAHFTEYFLLGLLAVWSARRLFSGRSRAAVLYCMAVACADEGIQLAVPGRSGELKDVLLDLSGALFAIVLFSLAAHWRKKRDHGGGRHGRDRRKEKGS